MLAGFPYCFAESEEKILFNIKFIEIRFPKHFSKEVKDLLKKLVEKNSKNRLGSSGVNEIKSHSWFKGIDWDDVYNKKLDVKCWGLRE